MIRILIVIIFLSLAACTAESSPAHNTGWTIFRATSCGIDTREFYELATEEEKIETANWAASSVKSTCTKWDYGTRDEWEKVYNRLIAEMRKRRNI